MSDLRMAGAAFVVGSVVVVVLDAARRYCPICRRAFAVFLVATHLGRLERHCYHCWRADRAERRRQVK